VAAFEIDDCVLYSEFGPFAFGDTYGIRQAPSRFPHDFLIELRMFIP
jgi:hypothetical protein